jgi:hypothetical protein
MFKKLKKYSLLYFQTKKYFKKQPLTAFSNISLIQINERMVDLEAKPFIYKR